jgi:hypothetical protein
VGLYLSNWPFASVLAVEARMRKSVTNGACDVVVVVVVVVVVYRILDLP